jgi:hypothetical protein
VESIFFGGARTDARLNHPVSDVWLLLAANLFTFFPDSTAPLGVYLLLRLPVGRPAAMNFDECYRGFGQSFDDRSFTNKPDQLVDFFLDCGSEWRDL